MTKRLWITCAAVAAAAVGLVVPERPAGASLLQGTPKLYNFQLDDAATARITLLAPFHDAAIERPGPMRSYLASPWGRWGSAPWWSLTWSQGFSSEPSAPSDSTEPTEPLFGFEPHQSGVESALQMEPEQAPTWLQRLLVDYVPSGVDSTGASFSSNGFDAIWALRPLKPKPDWRCRRRPVQFVRYGAETDSFDLVRCDGAVAPQALDRLTVMMRLPEAPRPGDLLPDEPDPESVAKGEWSPGVRVVNPRLLWALQRISDAFPWRTVYVFSGYRQKKGNEKPGSHHSLHSDARAIDILVQGIPNAQLFKLCRTLDDVGCGYYPNSKFVHVDVRKPGTGHAFWVDASGPGEPSNYVDSWPGVVEKGALVWDPAAVKAQAAEAATAAGADKGCTRLNRARTRPVL